jgi:hypothetical protein
MSGPGKTDVSDRLVRARLTTVLIVAACSDDGDALVDRDELLEAIAVAACDLREHVRAIEQALPAPSHGLPAPDAPEQEPEMAGAR